MYVLLGNPRPKVRTRRAVPETTNVDLLRGLAKEWGIPLGYREVTAAAEGEKVEGEWIDYDIDQLRSVMEDWTFESGFVDGRPCTTPVSIPEGMPLSEAFVTITLANGVWASHAFDAPSWVESDSPGLAGLLSEYYGCPIGAPDDVEETHHTDSGPPGVGPAALVEATR